MSSTEVLRGSMQWDVTGWGGSEIASKNHVQLYNYECDKMTFHGEANRPMSGRAGGRASSLVRSYSSVSMVIHSTIYLDYGTAVGWRSGRPT